MVEKNILIAYEPFLGRYVEKTPRKIECVKIVL